MKVDELAKLLPNVIYILFFLVELVYNVVWSSLSERCVTLREIYFRYLEMQDINSKYLHYIRVN